MRSLRWFMLPAVLLLVLISGAQAQRLIGSQAAVAGVPDAAFDVDSGSSPDIVTAEALFREGVRLSKEGRYAEACAKLEESLRIDRALGTLLYLAACYQDSGKTASAWATFELAASEARKTNQLQRERLARERARLLEERLSTLTVLAPSAADVQGLRVTRDGTEIRAASFGVAIPVDPGEHWIRATAPGRKPWSHRVLVEAPLERVVVQVAVLEPAQVPQATITQDTSTETQNSSGRPHSARDTNQQLETVAPTPMTLVIGSIGLVGIGVGTWLFIESESKEMDSKTDCDAPDYRYCGEEGRRLIERAKRLNTMGYVVGGLGAAALAGGVVLHLFAMAARESNSPLNARLTPTIGSRVAGVHLDGIF